MYICECVWFNETFYLSIQISLTLAETRDDHTGWGQHGGYWWPGAKMTPSHLRRTYRLYLFRTIRFALFVASNIFGVLMILRPCAKNEKQINTRHRVQRLCAKNEKQINTRHRVQKSQTVDMNCLTICCFFCSGTQRKNISAQLGRK